MRAFGPKGSNSSSQRIVAWKTKQIGPLGRDLLGSNPGDLALGPAACFLVSRQDASLEPKSCWAPERIESWRFLTSPYGT